MIRLYSQHKSKRVIPIYESCRNFYKIKVQTLESRSANAYKKSI